MAAPDTADALASLAGPWRVSLGVGALWLLPLPIPSLHIRNAIEMPAHSGPPRRGLQAAQYWLCSWPKKQLCDDAAVSAVAAIGGALTTGDCQRNKRQH